jgi:hypothetical protein
MLNDREAPTCQFTAHLEMNPKPAEIDEGPITRSHVYPSTLHQRTVLPGVHSAKEVLSTPSSMDASPRTGAAAGNLKHRQSGLEGVRRLAPASVRGSHKLVVPCLCARG